jgi:Cu/Ag efflux protein CusF
MALWRVAVLMNLALVVGVSLGYLAWGRSVERLERELLLARQRAAVVGVEQSWSALGVVRAVLPESNTLILTHEEIPGYMSPMTMAFRVKDGRLLEGVEVGDLIRFTLGGAPPKVEIVEVTRVGKS